MELQAGEDEGAVAKLRSMVVAALQVVGVVQWSRGGGERVESGRAWACGLDKNRDWVGGG